MNNIVKVIYFLLCVGFFSMKLSEVNDIYIRILFSSLLVCSMTYFVETAKEIYNTKKIYGKTNKS